MGAFNILKRFRSAPAPAEASTATDKAATATAAGRASSKSKKPSRTVHSDSDAVASGAANPTVSVPVSAVAPRVDLSILRSPSPPLVDVPLEGYRDNSPWVDLAADVEPPRRGSFGFRYLASTSSPTSREVSQKLKSYLDDKRITPAQANVLVRECLKALQGQGEYLLCG